MLNSFIIDGDRRQSFNLIYSRSVISVAT